MTYRRLEDFVTDWLHQARRKLGKVRPWTLADADAALNAGGFVPAGKLFRSVSPVRLVGTRFGDWVLSDRTNRTMAVLVPGVDPGSMVALVESRLGNDLHYRVRTAIVRSGVRVIDLPSLDDGLQVRGGFDPLRWWQKAGDVARSQAAGSGALAEMASWLLGMHELLPGSAMPKGVATPTAYRAGVVFHELGEVLLRLTPVSDGPDFARSLMPDGTDECRDGIARLQRRYGALPDRPSVALDDPEKSDDPMRVLYLRAYDAICRASSDYDMLKAWARNVRLLLKHRPTLDRMARTLPTWKTHPWLRAARRLHWLAGLVESDWPSRAQRLRTRRAEALMFEDCRQADTMPDRLVAAYDVFLMALLAAQATALSPRLSSYAMRYRASAMRRDQLRAMELVWAVLGHDPLFYLPWRDAFHPTEVPAAVRLTVARRLGALGRLVEEARNRAYDSRVRVEDLFSLHALGRKESARRVPVPQWTGESPSLLLVERFRLFSANAWERIPDETMAGWMDALQWLADNLGQPLVR